MPRLFAYLIATPTAFGYVDDGLQVDCEVRADWILYLVEEGDTLLSVALAADIDLIELRAGNCYNPIRGIFAGEELLVPQLPTTLAVGTPLFPAETDQYSTVGCESDQASIQSPPAMTELKGIFALIGRAIVPDGGAYRLSLRPAWLDSYIDYGEFESPVDDDVLGLINTEIFGLGMHWLRLTLLDDGGEVIDGSICEVPLVFTAPQPAQAPQSQS